MSQFCNSEYDNLVKQAKVVQDQSDRAKLYEKAQVIFKQQAPWFTIAHVSQYRVIRKEVVGFQMNTVGHHSFRKVDLLAPQ